VIEILIFGVNHIQLSDEYDCCFIYLFLYKINTFKQLIHFNANRS